MTFLACARKILHPTLFHFNDFGAMTPTSRFEQEHPETSLRFDPETQLPVLLMELTDDNLTHFWYETKSHSPITPKYTFAMT